MRIFRNIEDLPAFKNAVITIGSFDGVHMGHQKIIERIRSLAAEINGESIMITFHPHPRKIVYPKDKSLNLLSTLNEKLALFRNYGIDNTVVVPFSVEFSQLNPREYIEKFLLGKFTPRYIVIGYDHRYGLNRTGDVSLLKQYEAENNFNVIEIRKQEIDEITISSTKIRKALHEGNVETASVFLNHSYTLSGKVVHGDKIGQKIGYPTANIDIEDQDKLIPHIGVYAVKVWILGDDYNGMLYIGNRPTLPGEQKRNIEVNIFDFNDNIYDQIITVEFIQFLRGDQKFADLEELTEALGIDEENARKALYLYHQRKKKPSRISLAILNFNGHEYLESFLPSVLNSSKNDIDIVVIDNASEDHSVDYLKDWHPEVKIVELIQNWGFAAGYNKGLTSIDSEYYVILNSDVLVEENWLDPIIKLMDKDKEIGICQPVIMSLLDKSYYEYAGAAGGFIDSLGYPFCRGRIFNTCEKNEGQYPMNAEIFWASGAAMVIRSSLFKKLGGFDADYFAHQEEIDLCWRVKRAGYKIVCCTDSKVYHMGGGTLDYEKPKKTYLNFRNNLFTLLKNESGRKLWLVFPLRLILDGVAGIQMIFQGRPKNAWAVVKAHWSVFANFGKYLNKRGYYTRLIDKNRINPPDTIGIISGSIVWKYFILTKKKFSDLIE